MAAKSQMVVIKIGHVEVLLPDDTGAAAVVKTLSKGAIVWHLGGSTVQLRREEMEVSLSYLKGSTKFEDENHQPVEPVMDKRKLLAAKSGVLELNWKGGKA